MRSESPNPDVATFRLIKGGESGVGLQLSDLFDREIELSILGLKIRGVIRAYPAKLINKLVVIQRVVDEKIQDEIDKAKRESS